MLPIKYKKDDLTIDELIVALTALKTKGKSPPPCLEELPSSLAVAMRTYSSDNNEGDITGEVEVDEDGNLTASIKYSTRCNSFG